LNGNRPITADTAVRLGIYFSMDPIFWINLQAEYDVRVAIRENKKTLQSRIRVYQPIAA
jgi:addiction module HigA family antidote